MEGHQVRAHKCETHGPGGGDVGSWNISISYSKPDSAPALATTQALPANPRRRDASTIWPELFEPVLWQNYAVYVFDPETDKAHFWGQFKTHDEAYFVAKRFWYLGLGVLVE